jgi:hypothetical protein
MLENISSVLDSACEIDLELLAEFGQLWVDADSIWNQYQDTPAFHSYVSADYLRVYHSLARLRGSATTVLEWGSGLGVVSIMASRMGFKAYGIEAELGLIEHAVNLASAYRSGAQFAEGSFVPCGYQQSSSTDPNTVYRTMINAASAYGNMQMELRDFDLIYAYPWPRERLLYHDIISTLGRDGVMYLTYDLRTGMELLRFRASPEHVDGP